MNMDSTIYHTNLVYSYQQAREAVATARRWDSGMGGLYDAGTSAINVWSNPRTTPEMRRESELEGTIHIEWDKRNYVATISALETHNGWSVRDLERHIALLFGTPLPSGRHS